MEKRLLNINETAEMLGVKPGTLYAWVCQRKIPFVKCGRLTKFDIQEINIWIIKNTVKESNAEAEVIKNIF